MNEITKPNLGEGKRILIFSLADGSTRELETTEFRYRTGRLLQSVGKKLGRPVVVSDIVSSYKKAFVSTASSSESQKLRVATAKALSDFARNHLIFTKKLDGRRIYSAFGVLDPITQEMIKIQPTLRQRLLDLVRKTVAALDRPVRSRDVITYMKSRRMRGISEKQIVHNMWALARDGRLKIAGRIYGDGHGKTLFLPAEVDLPAENTFQRLTFVDIVFYAFKELWEERAARAGSEGVLMLPISTAEVQERVNRMPELKFLSKRDWSIINVLKRLADRKSPRIQCLSRRNELKLWILTSSTGDARSLQNRYLSNSARVVEAVERAYRRSGGRPVNLAEIGFEITCDDSLALTGALRLSQHLFNLAWERIPDRSVPRSKTTKPLIARVGSVGNRAYYVPSHAPRKQSEAYINFQKIKRDWKNFKKTENISLIENCRLSPVRTGRARLFLQEVRSFIKRLTRIENTPAVTKEHVMLREEIEQMSEQGEAFLGDMDFANLPGDVRNVMKGLTCSETTKILAPFYPVAEKLQKNGSKQLMNQITGRIAYAFRRIPNSQFQTRSSSDARLAAGSLFESADLLMGVASRWGGSECRYQAFLAKQELGSLRDARFILPAFNSDKSEDRITGIACLAFLRAEPEIIYNLALKDPVAEVRQTALWAYSFMGGLNYRQLAARLSQGDLSLTVRSLAASIAGGSSEIEIWRM